MVQLRKRLSKETQDNSSQLSNATGQNDGLFQKMDYCFFRPLQQGDLLWKKLLQQIPMILNPFFGLAVSGKSWWYQKMMGVKWPQRDLSLA